MHSALSYTNPNKPALIAGQDQFTYSQVDVQVQRFASGILAGAEDLNEERIAFLIPASLEYVTVMHGIWRAGGIAIPLNTASAEVELEHCLSSTGVKRLIAVEPFLERIRPLCDKLAIVVSSVA